MTCRVCHATLEPVLDLGDQYLPDFTEPGAPRGKQYPLRLMICTGCTLLQLDETTPRELLYHERYGFKSAVNEAVRADLASVVDYALDEVPHPATWLDIASNDGTLLSFVPDTIERVGVDPLHQFAREAIVHANRIVTDFFDPARFGAGCFDVITSVSMFYDLDDPAMFVRGVREVLATHGVWVIQQNYAGDMIARNAVDNICHEHVTYFSVTSLLPLLASEGLEINDVAYSDVNGGCIRTMVSHRGRRPVAASVSAAVAREKTARLGEAATWREWGKQVRYELAKLGWFLERCESRGERVYVYGASTRGGTFLQVIGADTRLLPYAVERNPAKIGKVMAATGIPIISEDEMRADQPEYLLVSPWFFRDVFVDRERAYLAAGGQMVFPLPHFDITSG